MTDTERLARMEAANWKPATQYWKERHDAKSAALTAANAELVRLRVALRSIPDALDHYYHEDAGHNEATGAGVTATMARDMVNAALGEGGE